MRYDFGVTDLVRRALAVNQAFLALGNEQFEADGARFVRNRSIPDVRDSNHVAHVTASTPEEIDRLLARAEREFADLRYPQTRRSRCTRRWASDRSPSSAATGRRSRPRARHCRELNINVPLPAG